MYVFKKNTNLSYKLKLFSCLPPMCLLGFRRIINLFLHCYQLWSYREQSTGQAGCPPKCWECFSTGIRLNSNFPFLCISLYTWWFLFFIVYKSNIGLTINWRILNLVLLRKGSRCSFLLFSLLFNLVCYFLNLFSWFCVVCSS